AIAAHRAQIEKQIAMMEAGRDQKLDHAAEKFTAWESEVRPRAKKWTIVRPANLVSKKHATMEVLIDGSVLVSGDKPNNDTYDVEMSGDFAGVKSLRLEVLPDHSCPED